MMITYWRILIHVFTRFLLFLSFSILSLHLFHSRRYHNDACHLYFLVSILRRCCSCNQCPLNIDIYKNTLVTLHDQLAILKVFDILTLILTKQEVQTSQSLILKCTHPLTRQNYLYNNYFLQLYVCKFGLLL